MPRFSSAEQIHATAPGGCRKTAAGRGGGRRAVGGGCFGKLDGRSPSVPHRVSRFRPRPRGAPGRPHPTAHELCATRAPPGASGRCVLGAADRFVGSVIAPTALSRALKRFSLLARCLGRAASPRRTSPDSSCTPFRCAGVIFRHPAHAMAWICFARENPGIGFAHPPQKLCHANFAKTAWRPTLFHAVPQPPERVRGAVERRGTGPAPK
jgi:hypothetical protein